MSRAQQFMDAARSMAGSDEVRQAVSSAVSGRGGSGGGGNRGGGSGSSGGRQRSNNPQDDSFALDPQDFPTARERGSAAGTRIVAENASIDSASEVLSRSEYQNGPEGPMHVITPMVIPKGRRARIVIPILFLIGVGVAGLIVTLPFDGVGAAIFGVPYWILVVVLAAFLYWRQGMVMVPEGCRALISRFGKVEAEVGPGKVTLLNPWKRVSYIVNTTREYPFNAPIRQAPTKSGVQASVDLFLQFRITNAREFVFVLGAVQGFQDKLNNAISETTRSLIYEQEASGIYDLVGESTQRLLEQLNAQFQPAVELTTANITHAEPASKEYRMDLASPEMVRVAKEAYTYEYELNLRKEQNEGDLNKDLASLNETLSAIQADIARYQAQMDTALERETNRADAMARQRFVESEANANANAALLEAQALDIRAMSAALAPEILDYRFQQDVLNKLESLADSLPQIVRVGGDSDRVDFLQIAGELIGRSEEQLFTQEDMDAIRGRKDEIARRIAEREGDIEHLLEPPEATQVSIVPESDVEDDLPGADRVEEIRRSVSSDVDPEAVVAESEQAQGSSASPSRPQPQATQPRPQSNESTSRPQTPPTQRPAPAAGPQASHAPASTPEPERPPGRHAAPPPTTETEQQRPAPGPAPEQDGRDAAPAQGEGNRASAASAFLEQARRLTQQNTTQDGQDGEHRG